MARSDDSAEIRGLRGCFQEDMATAVRRRQPLTSHSALQRIRRTQSPESLAREMRPQAQAAGQANFWLLFALLS